MLEAMDLDDGMANMMSPQPSKVWTPAQTHPHNHGHSHPHQHTDGNDHSPEDSDDEGNMSIALHVKPRQPFPLFGTVCSSS